MFTYLHPCQSLGDVQSPSHKIGGRRCLEKWQQPGLSEVHRMVSYPVCQKCTGWSVTWSVRSAPDDQLPGLSEVHRMVSYLVCQMCTGRSVTLSVRCAPNSQLPGLSEVHRMVSYLVCQMCTGWSVTWSSVTCRSGKLALQRYVKSRKDYNKMCARS